MKCFTVEWRFSEEGIATTCDGQSLHIGTRRKIKIPITGGLQIQTLREQRVFEAKIQSKKTRRKKKHTLVPSEPYDNRALVKASFLRRSFGGIVQWIPIPIQPETRCEFEGPHLPNRNCTYCKTWIDGGGEHRYPLQGRGLHEVCCGWSQDLYNKTVYERLLVLEPNSGFAVISHTRSGQAQSRCIYWYGYVLTHSDRLPIDLFIG